MLIGNETNSIDQVNKNSRVPQRNGQGPTVAATVLQRSIFGLPLRCTVADRCVTLTPNPNPNPNPFSQP